MILASIVSAILLMGIAHILRTLRWELFIEVYEKPDRKRLLRSISLGYLINYFVPYKLGDVARGYLAGRKMKNGLALGFSTVIVDRYLDVISVGVIFLVLRLLMSGDASIAEASSFYIWFFVALVGATLLVFIFRGVLKKLIRAVASLFNTRIETWMMFTAWALIWNFKDIIKKISKLKMIFYTLGMWSFYLLSYASFGLFYSLVGTQTTWTDIFLMLFGENGVKASTLMLSLFSADMNVLTLYMLIYMVAPLLLLFAFSFVTRARNSKTETVDGYLNLLPQLNSEEKLLFLDRYFSNESRSYIENYLKISRGISIVRDYSAGSNATTMLCVNEKGTFYRKYAFDEEGKKLSRQVEWLEEKCSRVPVTKVLQKDVNDIYCYYDMPYYPNAIGLFEFLHSMPAEYGWNVIKDVFECLESSLYCNKREKAGKELVDEYIETKVIRNLSKIKESRRLKDILDSKTVFINGKEYNNLNYYDKYLSPDYLRKVFDDEEICDIHGDLTVENIVCLRDSGAEASFYLIDPNTGNVLDSPGLDYAKMLQSIHGGYEFLMSVKNVEVTDNHIDFLFVKSYVYSDIYKKADAYLREQFSEKKVKSIYFHEIVHWLRLMPYKIEKDYRTAYAFYAGMLIVLDDIIKRFEKQD